MGLDDRSRIRSYATNRVGILGGEGLFVKMVRTATGFLSFVYKFLV